MVIYADVVILVNFLFNGELLFFLHRILHKRIRPLRLILSSFLGGVAGLACFLPYLQPYLSVAVRYIMPFLISGICFGRKNILMNGLLVFALSFVFSGVLVFFKVVGFLGVIMILPVSFLVEKLRKKAKKIHKDTILFYGERRVRVSGFCDSGNLLTYKDIPVILAKDDVFQELCGRGFDFNRANEWIDSRDLKYIPYTTLGENGVIPGILIDSAWVDGTVYENVILGYMGKGLSEKVILSSVMA